MAEGVRIEVVAPGHPGLPARREVGGVPVRFVRYGPVRLAYQGEMHLLARRPMGRAAAAALLGCIARAVRGEARREQPDVVHVHWWLPGAVAVRLARIMTPVVVTVHGTDVALLDHHPQLAALARWALRGAARVEAVSTDLAARLERLTGRAADAVNPMPLPAERLRPLPHAPARPRPHEAGTPLRILAVGRMVPEKGLADLVAATRLLAAPATLTIVGEGPERERLAAAAAGLGVPLSLPGLCTPAELRAAYAQADVVVLASHREGLGLVAAEALAMGLPVVATDSGGARDVLDELVPPGDIHALAERLTAIAADPVGARRAAVPHAERVRAQLAPAAAAARTLDGWSLVTGALLRASR
jgi:glycosyltransferase involved in cell wall biosynthesis